MNRRDFLRLVPAAAAFGVSAYAQAGDQPQFFRVAQRDANRAAAEWMRRINSN